MNGFTPKSGERTLSGAVGNDVVISLPTGGYMLIGAMPSGDGSGGAIFGQRLDAQGREKGAAFVINTSTQGNQASPAATLLDNGKIMVVWESGHDAANGSQGTEIMGQVISQTGKAVGSEFQVNSYSYKDQGDPSIAAIKGGGAYVFWNNEENFQLSSKFDVYGKSVSNSGQSGDEDLVLWQSAKWTGALGDSSRLLNGKTAVVWQGVADNVGTNGVDVLLAIVNAGQSGTPTPIVVNQNVANNQTDPSVATLKNGNIAVAWNTYVDGRTALAGRIFAADGSPRGKEFVIDKYTGDGENPRDAEIVALKDGGFAVAFWEFFSRTTSNDASAYARRYDKTGKPVGSWEPLSDEMSMDDRGNPMLAVNKDGSFLATWSGSEVVTRLFEAETWGTGARDTLIGTNRADSLFGQGNADTIKGRGGADLLDGGKGNDTIEGGNGNDTIRGGGGADRIMGGAKNDTLDGGTGNDRMEGGAGGDEMKGGAGNDRLDGGTGRNTLTGNKGADTFVFGDKTTKTTIEDFRNVDTLLLDPALWAGTLSARKVVKQFADDSGKHVVFTFDDGESLVVKDVADADTLIDNIAFL